MADRIVIERLEFQSHIGITAAEREIAQPIGVDLELEYPPQVIEEAVASDAISHAIDYAKVSERVIQAGTAREFNLLETLGEQLAQMLFAEFPVSSVHLSLRKLIPPVKHVHGSIGVRLERTRDAYWPDPKPARFLMDHVHRLPKGIALDVAAGRGRNTLYLAAQGFTVEAIDRDGEALAELEAIARQRNLAHVQTRVLDLESHDHPPLLPKERYDVILVFFYLYRPLIPALLHALRPGGVLMYETFLIDNHLRYNHPRRQEFCLRHNELLRLVADLRILFYQEGEHREGHGNERAFTAQLIAQKEDGEGLPL